ncbi:MAG: tetratricopeptide repeat protein [Acidobacteriota bacterium]
MTEPSPGRLWLFRILAAVLGPLMVLGVLEMGLRLSGYGYPTDFWRPVPGRDAVVVNPAFGWRFFPPSLARRPVPSDLPVPKPAGSYRIFVLGGSAAMGIPDPAFGFGRMLQAMLEDAFPETEFEVVNAAMTAINSHVVLPIARDAGRLEPDLFVVYMGNNEVVGPWGAGTVLKERTPSLLSIRASVALQGTRTGQGMAALAKRWTGGGDGPTGWRGMGLFLEHRLAADDPALALVEDHFRRNLEGIVAAGRSAGARVIVATPAVDLKDTPPFASLHRRDLPEEDRERFAGLLRTAKALAAGGDWESAAESLDTLLALDDRYAEARFLRGRAAFALGDHGAARRHLEAARDLDALRFRADSRLQGAVREVVADLGDDGVELLDAAEVFARASTGGAPGGEWFWEHVHLRPEGSHLLAAAVFGEVVNALPEAIRRGRRPSPASLERCAARLALGPFDRHRQVADIHALMAKEPFTFQWAHGSRRRTAALVVESLADAGTSPEGLRRSRRGYAEALARYPEDLALRGSYAALLRAAGEPTAAARELQRLLERIPRDPTWLTDLGLAHLEAGDFDGAESALRRAEAVDPHSPDLPFNLGILEIRRDRLEEAAEHFRRALDRDPGHVASRLDLAEALEQLGRTSEALEAYRTAASVAPEDPEARRRYGVALSAGGDPAAAAVEHRAALALERSHAPTHYNLGIALERLGDLGGAAKSYRTALRYDPGLSQARDNLGELYNGRGAELARGGDLAAAVEAFKRAAEIRPDHAPTRYNLANALGLAGQVDDGVSELRRALQLARVSGPPELVVELESRLRALGR